MDTTLNTLDKPWPGIKLVLKTSLCGACLVHVFKKVRKRTELKWMVLKLMFLKFNTFP